MTDINKTITIPRALFDEVLRALNKAPRFRYTNSVGLTHDSYGLVSAMDRFAAAIGHSNGLERYAMSDQPEQCPKCGARTENLGPQSGSDQQVWCPNCGYTYMLSTKET